MSQLWSCAAQQLSSLSWRAVAADAAAAALSLRLLLAAQAKRASAQAKQAHECAVFSLRSTLALGLWLLSPVLVFFSLPLAFAVLLGSLAFGDLGFQGWAALAASYLAALALLVALPLELRPPAWVQGMLRWIMSTGESAGPDTL